MIKRVPKEVYVTAHYEITSPEGDTEKSVKVKGGEWKNVVEKEFTIVLYADRKLNDKKEVEAWFDMSLEGTSSKCPPDLISGNKSKFDNDLKFVQECIEEYVK